MKHAGPAALDLLEPLLARVRGLPDLKEKGRGTFYLKSRAFLHFHEDPAGLFADVRLAGKDFTRLRVSDPAEQDELMRMVTGALPSPLEGGRVGDGGVGAKLTGRRERL